METPPIHLERACEKGVSTTSRDPWLLNDHPALSISNTGKEELLTDDINQKVKPCCTKHLSSQLDQDYMEKIRELHERLDMVKKIVRPGCSNEVLNTALSFMSRLATILSESQMPQNLHASL